MPIIILADIVSVSTYKCRYTCLCKYKKKNLSTGLIARTLKYKNSGCLGSNYPAT